MKMPCSSRLKFVTVALCSLALLGVAGCRKAAKTPFPPSGAAEGWSTTGDARTFAPKDLWQYIDGQAEQYVQAGVVSVSTADYVFHNQFQAVVDVYTMRDAAGAKTILASDKAGSTTQPVSLGDDAVALEQSITFCKGPYLVRIVAYESRPETAAALMALAHSVEARL